MTDEPNIELMNTIYPEPTARLEAAIAAAEQSFRERHPNLNRSRGCLQEAVVEPMLEALGFTEPYRRMAFKPCDHLVLSAAGTDVVVVLVKTPSGSEEPERWASVYREITNFQGRIVVTDGSQWDIYRASTEDPNVSFDIRDPAAFWDLLMLGQANHHPPTER